jgi:hypothetical protein
VHNFLTELFSNIILYMNNQIISDTLSQLKNVNNSITFDSKNDYKQSCLELKKSKIVNRIIELLQELIILNNSTDSK